MEIHISSAHNCFWKCVLVICFRPALSGGPLTVPYIWKRGLIYFSRPLYLSLSLSLLPSLSLPLSPIAVFLVFHLPFTATAVGNKGFVVKKIAFLFFLTTFYHLWSYRFASVLTIKLDLFEWLWFLNNFFWQARCHSNCLLLKTVFQFVRQCFKPWLNPHPPSSVFEEGSDGLWTPPVERVVISERGKDRTALFL